MSDLPEMPCAELVERLTDYLENVLSPTDRQRLEEHLAGCDACSTYVEQMRQTLALTGSLAAADVVAAEVPDELIRAFIASRSNP